MKDNTNPQLSLSSEGRGGRGEGQHAVKLSELGLLGRPPGADLTPSSLLPTSSLLQHAVTTSSFWASLGQGLIMDSSWHQRDPSLSFLLMENLPQRWAESPNAFPALASGQCAHKRSHALGIQLALLVHVHDIDLDEFPWSSSSDAEVNRDLRARVGETYHSTQEGWRGGFYVGGWVGDWSKPNWERATG